MSNQLFLQSQAAGALTTYMFHLALTAGGADATGKTPAVAISKAGGAFGAAAGTVSEISAGWYKVAFTAADLDTLGTLGIKVTEATSVTVNDTAQVVAVNPYDAAAMGMTGVPVASIATDAVNSAALAASAVTEMQSGLATHTDVTGISVPSIQKTFAMGTISADGASTGVDCGKALAVTLTATGTFGSGTIQVQTCADPTAVSPVWVNVSGATLTSNGSKSVTLPARAVRWNMTGSTSPSVVCTATVTYPA